MKSKLLFVFLVFMILGCNKNNIDKINLNEIFPELINPNFISTSFENITWNSKYYNILTDFNSDGVKDLIFVGSFSPEENQTDTLCFFSILSLPENNKPKIDFFSTTDSKECSVQIESNNEILFSVDTFGFLSVKFKDGKYESKFHEDEFVVDPKLNLVLNEKVDDILGLVFLSKIKYNNTVKWTGYNPSHKDSKSHTIINTIDIGKNIIYPPTMSDDWFDEFEFHIEIELLLVKTNSHVDSLANFYWGKELIDISIGNVIDKIKPDNIVKNWSISKEKMEECNWVIQYP
jgi:hypothetical protein